MPEPAISEATAAARLKPGATGRHISFCRLCEAFCGLAVDVDDGRMTKVMPDRENPHSLGHVCVKGTSALDLVYDPDRLLQPMRRVGGPGEFEPVGWDEAMADIAARLADIIRRGGPDAVANYIGNPTAYSNGAQVSIRPFLAHFGIWKMFSAATQDVTARMMASFLAYGSAFRFAIPDLDRCDFLLVIGANPLVSHGSALTAPRIREDLDAIAARGRVVVVDPRATETAQRYEHISITPDTDIWMLAAMINTLVDEGLADLDAARKIATGIDELRAQIGYITPDLAERHCGVPAADIAQLARDFAAAPRAAAYSRVGLCRGSFSTLAIVLHDALNLLAGKFGVVGGSVFGDSPIDLARVRPSGVETRQTRFGPKPYVASNLRFSMLADEILTPGKGQVQAFLMESGNIVVSAPGGDRLEKALGALDLFVAHDLYINETNRYAHYILPGATFLERADVPTIAFPHMVRPFAQYTDAVIPPRGETRNEHELFNELAARLHDHLSADPGLSLYRSEAPPFFDPLLTIDGHMRDGGVLVETDCQRVRRGIDLLARHPHGVVIAKSLTCTNSLSKVVTPDGRVHLWDPVLDAEAERLRAAPQPVPGELRLFSIRTLKSMNSWLHNVEKLTRSQYPALMIHPDDAAERGLVDGGRACVATASGRIEVDVSGTARVARGAVCYPHGWGHRGGSWQRANAIEGANVNLLADPRAGDAISASSFLDGIVVEVTPA